MNYKNRIKELLNKELERQENEINLIASENAPSMDVLEACGSCIQSKYSEGYVGNRYYAGCENVDEIETICKDLTCKIFNTKYANVQAHAGSVANLAVYSAVTKLYKVEPKDVTIIGLALDSAGHLTHSSPVSISGVFFNSNQYHATDEGLIDYDEMERKVKETEGVVVLVVGCSSYPRMIDYKRIADFVKSLGRDIVVLHDVSHVGGLIAGGECENPMNFDHGKARAVLTTTTHKTLKSARHAVIATNNEQLAKKIDQAVFPFLQGGQLPNMMAGTSVGLAEALEPSFKEYAKQVKANIKAMEKVFNKYDIKMISGGSDNHLILLDLRDELFTGKQLEDALTEIGIITNKNAVVNDTRSRFETSGLRIGTACITARGMKEEESKIIAEMIVEIIRNLRGDDLSDVYDSNNTIEQVISSMVQGLTEHFPLYSKYHYIDVDKYKNTIEK